MERDRMLQWFGGGNKGSVAEMYRDMAVFLTEYLAPGPERTVALRKLLESKDAATRAIREGL